MEGNIPFPILPIWRKGRAANWWPCVLDVFWRKSLFYIDDICLHFSHIRLLFCVTLKDPEFQLFADGILPSKLQIPAVYFLIKL